MQTKFFLCAALVAVASTSLPAFAEQNSTQALTVQVPVLPTSLDPLSLDPLAKTLPAFLPLQTKLTSTGSSIQVESSKDLKVFTLKLQGGFWSDGKPVRAQEYVAAVQRFAKNPRNHALVDLDLVNAKQVAAGELPVEQLGVKALDNTTLELRFSHPVSNAAVWLDSIFFSPYRADAQDGKVSSGPYYLASKSADKFVYKANPYSNLQGYPELVLTTQAKDSEVTFSTKQAMPQQAATVNRFLALNYKALTKAQRLVLAKALELEPNYVASDFITPGLATKDSSDDRVSKAAAQLKALSKDEALTPSKLTFTVLAWEGDKAKVEAGLAKYQQANKLLAAQGLSFALSFSVDYVDYPTYLKRLQDKDYLVSFVEKNYLTTSLPSLLKQFTCLSAENFFNYCNQEFDRSLAEFDDINKVSEDLATEAPQAALASSVEASQLQAYLFKNKFLSLLEDPPVVSLGKYQLTYDSKLVPQAADKSQALNGADFWQLPQK